MIYNQLHCNTVGKHKSFFFSLLEMQIMIGAAMT